MVRASGRPSRTVSGHPSPSTPNLPAFAHGSELRLAHFLSFYGVPWQYEPHTFPLVEEEGRILRAFTPDFYLPDNRLYIELTTLRQSLVTEKNRKVRLLRARYPGLKIRLLYRHDYAELLRRFSQGQPQEGGMPEIDEVLIPAAKLRRRVRDLAARISQDYAGREPVLVGVLGGAIYFFADLTRQLSIPVLLETVAISSYDNDQPGVRLLKDLKGPIAGLDVLVIEDIVDTGLTLQYLQRLLEERKPASIRVCTLLDKPARRLVDVQLDYVGFTIPDRWVVGYGLDYRQRLRNLPYIATIRPEEA